MYRKLTALFLTAVLSLTALAGCGQTGSQTNPSGQPGGDAPATGQAPDTDLLAAIRERGEIIIATEGTWAPWTYHDESDQLVGYDVEVARAVAEKLGVEASFVEGEWDGLLAGIDAGRYDIMANGVDVDDARRQQYDFSIPYAYNRVAIIVQGDNDEITGFQDLEGKTTANTLNSTYAVLAQENGANVTAVDDLNQTLELLLAGRIDATLNSEVTYYDYMNAHPDANLKIAALTQDATQVAIPMQKGQYTASLREAIDQALTQLREDGTLSSLSQKYFGADISQPQAAQ